MNRELRLRLLNREDMERIHEYSLRILAENGITFRGEALDIFKEKGFRVEGEQVYFTKSQVEEALKTCPSSFLFEGGEEKYNLEIGTNRDFGVSGATGPTHVSDLENGRREGALEDTTKLTKIYHASDIVNIMCNGTIEASDVDFKERHLKVQFEILKNSTKPIFTKILPRKQMEQVLDMTEIARGGIGSMKNHVYIGISSAPSLSPLAWDEETADCIIALAQRGQLITLGTGTTTGITGPIKVMGTLVLQNAELLSGIILAQIVNPGTPVGYGTGAMAGNMINAQYGCGSPTRMLLEVASIEMGKNFYNIPSRVLTYGTDSTCIDFQMGIENYEGTLGGIISDADYVFSEMGTLAGLMTLSYEKSMIDEELTARMLHIRKGIDVSEASASVDLIIERGSGSEYITSIDTLENFQDEWYPTITDWTANYKKRPENDYEYAIRRANEAWKDRLRNAPESVISKEVEKELIEYMEKALI